jgi:polygalacturonase
MVMAAVSKHVRLLPRFRLGLRLGLLGVLIGLAANSQLAASLEELPPGGDFDVVRFGARGDGTNDDTAAIQKAIAACTANGGGRVVLPGGHTFLCGAITLQSRVDFHLQRGAVLKASPRWRDYGPAGALLFAKDVVEVSISGGGVIDGNDRAVWQELADEEAGGKVDRPGWWPQAFCGEWWPFWRNRDEAVKIPGRPRLLLLIGCRQVRLTDFTLRNAPSWTVHAVGCEDMAISCISIRNAWDVPNNDGLDLDHCRNVRVTSCHIEAADDAIALKNTSGFADYGPCENITVTGCTLSSRSSAIKLDEVYAPPGIRNVIFDACVIYNSNRGVCIQSRDEGSIEDVLFANLTIQTRVSPHKWWGAAEPISITHYPRNKETHLGRIQRIRFTNLLCRGENGVYIVGWKGNPIEEVTLDNFRIELGRFGGDTGGFYDGRPDGLFQGVYTNTIAALHCEHARNLTLRHGRVVWNEKSAEYFGPALRTEHMEALTIEDFEGKSADSKRFPDRMTFESP